MFLGAVEGIRTFPTPLLEMARLFRTPQRLLLSDLYFPHLLFYLFPSLVAGLGLAWRVTVMAELLSSETGIGAELNLARINLDTDEVMAWIAIVVISIWISEYLLLRPLRRRLEPWRPVQTPTNINKHTPSELGVKYLGLKPKAIERSLTKTPLEMVTAVEAKEDLEFWFSRPMKKNPKLLQGKLPNAGFYYG